MIDSKDLVKKAINFKGPERIPYMVSIDLVRFKEKRDKEEIKRIERLYSQCPVDIFSADIMCASYWKPQKRPPLSVWSLGPYYHREEREDEWGVIWKELRVIGHPLEKDWSLAKDYQLPDPYAPGRFDGAKKLIDENRNKYTVGLVWFTLFERLWMLRGFNNMLVDPYLNYDEFINLRDKILNLNIALIKQWLKIGVDAIWISDDWGGQETILMNPDDWRKFYKPCYKKMFDLIHKNGAHVWMHSDGNITQIIPDLIEIGLNVLHPVQSQAMNIEELGKRFGGKLCFFGGADVQETLPHGTPQQVKEEVRYLIKTFGKYKGGYIGSTSHTILPDTPLKNIEALFEAFDEYCSNPKLILDEMTR